MAAVEDPAAKIARPAAEPVELKRSLSLTLITFYGLGTILGAGIYALVGKVAASAGIFAPFSFLVAAGVAMLTGLSYAELSARFPRSAGAALYVFEGFRQRTLSVITGFLVILTGVVSAATLTNGFVGYFHVFAQAPDWIIITLLVLAMGGIAAWGIGESVRAAAFITLIELAGLGMVLWAGAGSLVELPARWMELVPPADLGAWQGIFLGGFLAFYAFIGFEDTVNVAEEVKDPRRSLPRAILLSLAIATALYLLVAVVVVLALPMAELTQSRAPLALLYERTSGQPPVLISLISLFAVVNGALIQIIMGSRLVYGMSREGWLPPVFARVHVRRRTPLEATAVITLIVLALALWLPLVTLAKVTSFVILVVFALINVALVRVKLHDAAPPGVRTYPSWVPVAGCATTLGLVILQLVEFL